VTRYNDGNSSDAAVDQELINQNHPQIPERAITDVSDANDIFISHKWGRIESPSDKRIKIKLILTNVDSLGKVYKATAAGSDNNQTAVSQTAATDFSEQAPGSFEEAVQDPLWCESMKSEVNALKKRGCWRVVRTPYGVRLIKSKFVYKLKKDWAGKITKRKSRLVVQVFSQVEGVDYNETFAPVAKATTFRLMLALARVLKLRIHQLDVDSAFPYADLDEDVYITPPPGMRMDKGYCLKLEKSLYGLKQAPRNWNKNIVDYIKSLGFQQCILDNCLFVKHVGDEVYLISLYVDDILIAGSKINVIEEIKGKFTQKYEMKDLGEVNYYLGMRISRSEDYIGLDQTGYIREVLNKYDDLLRGLEHRHYTTPMERDLKLRKVESIEMSQKHREYVDKFPYQNIVGALLYLAINTRPDISYTVGVLARFNTAPNYRACKALIRVLVYLRDTAEFGIKFRDDDFNLFAYSDADWAGDLDSRRSTTGYVVYAAGGPIAWQSKLQSTVAVSTMEAEYMAAFGAIQELIWIKGVLSEVGFDYVDPIILHMDSKSAMALAKNPTHYKRSKHIDIKYHWLREHTYESGIVQIEHCKTENMVAVYDKGVNYGVT